MKFQLQNSLIKASVWWISSGNHNTGLQKGLSEVSESFDLKLLWKVKITFSFLELNSSIKILKLQKQNHISYLLYKRKSSSILVKLSDIVSWIFFGIKFLKLRYSASFILNFTKGHIWLKVKIQDLISQWILELLLQKWR